MPNHVKVPRLVSEFIQALKTQAAKGHVSNLLKRMPANVLTNHFVMELNGFREADCTSVKLATLDCNNRPIYCCLRHKIGFTN